MERKINITFNDTTKIAVSSLAILLVVFLVSSSIIKMHRNQEREIRLKTEEEYKKLKLREEIDKVEKALDNYTKSVYKETDTLSLRDTISNIARETGVDLISVQPMEPQNIASFTKVSFKVKLNCTYNQLGKFIERIEALPEFTVAEALTASSFEIAEKDMEREVKAGAELFITAYFLKG